MKKVFHDKFQMECTFWDNGISFCNSLRIAYYPYGCMDSLNVSLRGVLQAVSRAQVGCFTASRQDKAEIRDLVKQGKEKMKTATREEPVILDLKNISVDQSLAPEEQLKAYKGLFVQGVISKDQYDMMKMLLTA